jgi:hypothetical protein
MYRKYWEPIVKRERRNVKGEMLMFHLKSVEIIFV